MDGPREYYALWNKSYRETQILYHLHIAFKNNTNEHKTKEKQTQKLVVIKEERKGGRDKLGIWD